MPNAVAAEIMAGKRLPELLSPAGSPEALKAAIDSGADAVYLGGAAFNARINAKNFTDDELRYGIELAHSYGVKVYIAANTLVFDKELDGFLRSVEYAYRCGADALIIADPGAAAEVRRRFPIELHASTQCSCHGAEAAELFSDAGFSRVVCAREMSRENIAAFVEASALEAEVFVHGALCVCHSGQCLFSSVVGGRSGNRGECAQPCRLPYNGRQNYPLSLKDLTLAAHITELCTIGVSSLKIEGRMKSPEYVRDVTRIFRRLLDERRDADKKELAELDGIFSRGGFTDAYFIENVGKGMLGVRSKEQKEQSRTLAPFEGITRKIKVEMYFSARDGEPMELTLKRLDSDREVTVIGEIPMVARTCPTDVAAVCRSLAKLGDTPFSVNTPHVELDGGLMLPVSQLNALRRRAVSELLSLSHKAGDSVKQLSDKEQPIGKRVPTRTAVFFVPENIPAEAYSYFDIIYTPLEKYTSNSNGVLLPPIIFDSEREAVLKMLKEAVKRGASHALISNAGHIELVKGVGMHVHGDFRLNVTNNPSSAFWEKRGLEDIILSPELSLPQVRDIGGKSFVCVYGRTPLMVTEKCVAREVADCKSCSDNNVVLTDRRGVHFPVFRTFEHRSIIFNSVPVYMADRQNELESIGACMEHFIFTVEKENEVKAIINAYKKRLPPPNTAEIKRIKF